LIEVEVKYKVECHELEIIEKKLIDMGYKLIKSGKEVDIYFNSPIRDFRISDEALRVRISYEGYFLTYKGKKMDKKTKTREELNVRIDNAEIMQKILFKLGFSRVKEVVKNRKIYFKDDVYVCLDKVENLGCFLELEKDVCKKDEVKDSIKKLKTLAEKLGIRGESITSSYLEMLINA